MDVRASEMGLSIKAVYEKGEVLLGEELILDLDAYRTQLAQAVGGAYKVAIEAAYVTPETLPSIIAKAVLAGTHSSCGGRVANTRDHRALDCEGKRGSQKSCQQGWQEDGGRLSISLFIFNYFLG